MTTPTRSNPDTELGTAFWREHPHLFVAAGWGAKYCRCCLNPKRRKIHEVAPDPSTHPGNCTGYRVRDQETWFAVAAWNDNGAACHYQSHPTYEQALAFVDYLREHGDLERDGRMWEHFQIEERTYFTAVDTNVVVLS